MKKFTVLRLECWLKIRMVKSLYKLTEELFLMIIFNINFLKTENSS